jgi:hypothetical protein
MLIAIVVSVLHIALEITRPYKSALLQPGEWFEFKQYWITLDRLDRALCPAELPDCSEERKTYLAALRIRDTSTTSIEFLSLAESSSEKIFHDSLEVGFEGVEGDTDKAVVYVKLRK